MNTLALLAPLALMQVGPNPNAANTLGVPDELANRPERPATTQALALTDANTAWLKSCLEQVESEPARAHALAQIKRSEASGTQRVVANHCLGLASSKLGLWEDARTAFIEARSETPESEIRAKARFGAMAGNAALAGGDPAGALALLETARRDAAQAASTPLQVIADLDMARALVALGRLEEGLAPLDAATTLMPNESEGWLLKATLLRRLDRLDEAQSAIEQAVLLAPMDGEIGLEAGVIAILGNREEAARQSWQSVIDIQPDSLAAQTAKNYLAQLGPAPSSPPSPAP